MEAPPEPLVEDAGAAPGTASQVQRVRLCPLTTLIVACESKLLTVCLTLLGNVDHAGMDVYVKTASGLYHLSRRIIGC